MQGAMAESETRIQGLRDLTDHLVAQRRAAHVVGLRGASRAVAVAHLARAHGDRPILVIVPTA
ncbi:MAG: hypothetical protein ACQGVC_05085 [Myxococcota bacterium]